MKVSLDIGKVNPAKYNPRKITEKEIDGLKNSMHEFGDISGITVNARTGNLVSGHQRFELIKREHTGIKFIHASGEIFNIVSESGPTGYDIRVVDWDEIKEKAANIAANAHVIQGKFDLEKLPFILDEVVGEFPDLGMNFDILSKDFGLYYEPEVKPEERPEGESDIDPKEAKEVYDKNPIKQIHLFYSADDYPQIIERLNSLVESLKATSYSDAIVKLMDHYEDIDPEEIELGSQDISEEIC